jgi:hypothetical protein
LLQTKKNSKYHTTTQPRKINTNFHQAINVPNYVVYMRVFQVFNAKNGSQFMGIIIALFLSAIPAPNN